MGAALIIGGTFVAQVSQPGLLKNVEIGWN